MDFGLCRHNNIAICGLESTDEQKLQNLSHSCFSRPPTLLTLMLVTDGQTSSRTPTFGLKRQFFGSSGGFVSVARLCLSLQELLPSLPARLQHLSNTSFYGASQKSWWTKTMWTASSAALLHKGGESPGTCKGAGLHPHILKELHHSYFWGFVRARTRLNW